jgi:3-oxoacyl-[acyl-carrier-protein] synthase III
MIQTNPPSRRPTSFGISAISTFRPQQVIPNEWYESALPRKFVNHTGIESRHVSFEDEVTMACHSVRRLVNEAPCDLSDCAAVVFATPSFVPMAIANRYMDREQARQEQPTRAAYRVVETLGIEPRRVLGINGFCSGYAKALSLVKRKFMPTLELSDSEFILVITSSRISRITDYSCRQSGALFGDLATATLLSRTDSTRYPVAFEVVDARYSKKPVNRAYFDFSEKEDVLVPTDDGGRSREAKRLVFSMDGMGIADTAPRAMAASALEVLVANAVNPREIAHIVPHQAGDGILRLAEMKLEDVGLTAEVVRGMAREVGNVSSGSVPFALKRLWKKLHGNILCPVAAVGGPGKCEVSQGCILLKASDQKKSLAA